MDTDLLFKGSDTPWLERSDLLDGKWTKVRTMAAIPANTENNNRIERRSITNYFNGQELVVLPFPK
ncbi:MAG TPA: hypothetical protein VFD35_01585 [Pricia sp.]|nr:hypothetical protein [Pricia sp.]